MPSTKAKINKQNTRHGKMDMPFASLNKYAGMAKGGDVKKEMKAAGIFAKAGEKKLAAHERREAMGKEKDTPAIAKKEMSVLKKSKAPKDVMDYEKAEHKSMGFARGGGIESKGKTKVKRFAEGGEADDLEEVSPTALKSSKSVQIDTAPETFKQMFARKRAEGAKDFTWNGKKYTTELASSKPPTAQAQTKHMVNTMRSTEKDVAAKKNVADVAKANTARATNSLQSEINRAQEKRERDMGSYGKDVSMYRSGGSVKKFAKGGGIESKGKTRGRYI